MKAARPNALARALRGFFFDYLSGLRGASPHTSSSYRDAWVLLLRFLADRTQRPVVALDLGDLDTANLVAFLEYLERERGNCVATRNTRLAAVHTFARYAGSQYPEWLETCQRLLAVPFKRTGSRCVEYLEADEIRALLEAIDTHTGMGRRDHALFVVLFNTGARVQEILDLRPVDLRLEPPRQARLCGKGRKERLCPIWPKTAEALKPLITETGLETTSAERLFRNRRGEPLTRFGVRYLLAKYTKLAQSSVPSLANKRVHPHTLRHTTAVHLLQAGVDLVTISHWLGHASVETTNRYLAVDLETKRAAIARLEPFADMDPALSTWKTDASILTWLEAL